jgi:hypothetical protein
MRVPLRYRWGQFTLAVELELERRLPLLHRWIQRQRDARMMRWLDSL